MKTTYPLTSKSQITVPKEVRTHLGLRPGGRAVFSIKPSGEVVINRPLTAAEIIARAGKPTGKQTLTEREKLRSEYLMKKYDIKP